MVLSAIWIKHERVSFSKRIKTGLSKETTLIRIKDIHKKCSVQLVVLNFIANRPLTKFPALLYQIKQR
jgi:hypothetical protein